MARFTRLGELDIGASTSTSDSVYLQGAGTSSGSKRRRDFSPPDNSESPLQGHLCAHFPSNSTLRSYGDQYRWVANVLRMAPYKGVKGSLELTAGRHNIYVKCKTVEFLELITTQGALGVVLNRPKVYGKGTCTNLIVFGVPDSVDMQELTDYNPRIVQARRVLQNKKPTQRVIITYEGPTAPKTIKIVSGLAPLRCAIFRPLTPFCTNCSRWGHGARACQRNMQRCKYCGGIHPSKDCAQKIAQDNYVPRKCVNCHGQHNAHSHMCQYYPKDRRKKNYVVKPSPPTTTTYHQAPSRVAPRLNDDDEFPSLPGMNIKTTQDIRKLTSKQSSRKSGAPDGRISVPKTDSRPNTPSRPVPEQTNAPVVSRNSAPTTLSEPKANNTPSSPSQLVPPDCPVTAMETVEQENTTASATPDTDTQQSLMAMMHLILKQIQDQMLQQQQFQERFMRELKQIQEHLSKLPGIQQQKTSEQPNKVLSKLFGN